MNNIVSQEIVESKIFLIRGEKVMLSSDLAKLYDVQVKVLMQAVRRNLNRFPEDFMFQLTWVEVKILQPQFVILKPRSQFVTLKKGKNIKYLPYAFTEQGVAMLSSVLRSRRAIQVNIAIMRAFVKLRKILSTHKELASALRELERKVEKHNLAIKDIFEAIRMLMGEPRERKVIKGFAYK